ncbi:outer membrane protein assembly factor BamD [Gammaproteobacteria bacterium]|nr:outer membrane protein assembly factor BamD [Gammaproteobacteria bacterium]
MIKNSIYILLIFLLAGCSSFQGKEEGQKIDRFGNTINTEGKILSAEQIYARAKSALKREQWEEAIESYREIESNHPFSEFAVQSHIELAFAEYKLKRWDSAIAVIDRFQRMNGTSKLMPYSYYLRGLINFHRGKNFTNYILPHVQIDKDPLNLRESYENFNYVFKNYKNSEYLKDSYKRMIYLRNTLASYELHVANYYFKRKAYIAVIGRCNYLIKNYPEAPANIDALLFLQKAYEAIMMKDSARDIEKIIKTNYPNYKSTYFKEVLDNKIKRNILAISEGADNIAIGLGFDIEDQVKDDFSGVYQVEYFNNENLIEIPRNIKPDRYVIKHKKKNEDNVYIEEESLNILDYFSDDDQLDLNVKDIIVGDENNGDSKNKNTKNLKEKEIELLKSTVSENEIIELIKN